MTDSTLPLADLLAKAGDGDFLRAVAEAVVQLLMEADVEGAIGAGRHERTADRQTYRNGFRDRALDTRLGTLQLRIPKLRQGSYFPLFLNAGRPPRRRWSPSFRRRGSAACRPVVDDHADSVVTASRRKGKRSTGPRGRATTHLSLASDT